jgi:hypothetical protein
MSALSRCSIIVDVAPRATTGGDRRAGGVWRHAPETRRPLARERSPTSLTNVEKFAIRNYDRVPDHLPATCRQGFYDHGLAPIRGAIVEDGQKTNIIK